MKVAVFGGSGFLGYSFVRHVLRAGDVTPIVYSSSPKSLTNLARHAVEIRLYQSSQPETIQLDPDVSLIINYAHPFEARDNISGADQIQRFVRFVGAAKRAKPDLRLIHLSTMSVFEPFAPGHFFAESSPLKPPKSDRYAREKVLAETALKALPDAGRWQLHLRPTIVYGPYCGVWADRIFEAFAQGDVGFSNLDGRIQPILGDDISRLIHQLCIDFRPGTYNLPGPEVMSWQAFLGRFRDIVGRGELVPVAAAAGAQSSNPESAFAFYRKNFRELMQAVRKEPSFDRMAVRIASWIPERGVMTLKDLLLGKDAAAGPPSSAAVPAPVTMAYCRPFFGEDRLIADGEFRAAFPDFRLTTLDDGEDLLRRYYAYRFTDIDMPPPSDPDGDTQ
jgi:nucleoside-diphosphate-sugar epimerase